LCFKSYFASRKDLRKKNESTRSKIAPWMAIPLKCGKGGGWGRGRQMWYGRRLESEVGEEEANMNFKPMARERFFELLVKI